MIDLPTIRPQPLVTSRIRLDLAGLNENGPGARFRSSRGRSLCLWRVQDSNLRSFRDGFTAQACNRRWPAAEPLGKPFASVHAPCGVLVERTRSPT